MKKHFFIFTLLLTWLSGFVWSGEPTPEVRAILEKALKLYSKNEYVQALDLFKQAQEMDPTNETASEYVKNTKQRILEWEMKGDDKPTPTSKEPQPTWDSLLGKKTPMAEDTASNAKDIIAARRSLVERMKSRSSSADNIVQIRDTGKSFEVVLFHDQLFLPGLQTLRDEALPILSNVSDLIRNGADRNITIKSRARVGSTDPYLLYPEYDDAEDPSLPQMKKSDAAALFKDIESTRALILFTYIAQKSLHKNTVSE